MSSTKPKYKRLEAFFARVRPPAPDSSSRSAEGKPAMETTGSIANGWGDFFSANQRGRIMGFIYNQGKVTTLEDAALPLPDNALRVPLTVFGKAVGSIQAAGKDAGWTAQDMEMVSAVAAELSSRLEHLDLEKQKSTSIR
jgi:hypothetical protein